MFRPAAPRGVGDVRGAAVHQLAERTIGIGREQPDHLLLEREHLDLDGLIAELHGDVVPA